MRPVADALEPDDVKRAAAVAEVAKAASPDARGINSGHMADAAGFIAMSCDDTLVHADDILKAFGRSFEPPPDLCRAILDRLFPDAPAEGDAWAVLCGSTAAGRSRGAIRWGRVGHGIRSRWERPRGRRRCLTARVHSSYGAKAEI